MAPKAPSRFRFWLFASLLALVVAFPAFLVIRPLPRAGDLGRSIRSLAVLPVVDLTTSDEGKAFADRLSVSLMQHLAETSSLNLVSRTNVERYRGTQRKAGQIARELGVDAVLEIAVEGHQDRARASVQLIDGRTDIGLWSENFQRTGGTERPLAEELAEEVFGELSKVLANGRPAPAGK